jgi:hypothetical protein
MSVISIQMFSIGSNQPIRGLITEGNEERYSVYDFMVNWCGYSVQSASKQFSRWISDSSKVKQEIDAATTYVKFPGKGQRETPTMTLSGLERLFLLMSGKLAAEFRKLVEDTFRRVMAGDRSLIQVIEANSESNGPVQMAYRSSIAQEPPASTLEDLCLKRKREELEIRKLELELQREEQKVQFGLMEKYDALCTNKNMDERAKILFKDKLLNSTILGGSGSISPEHTSISMSQFVDSKDPEMNPTKEQLMTLGKIASKLYRERYGQAPSKHTQMVGGIPTEVNTYFKKDQEILEKALDVFKNEELNKKGSSAGASVMNKWLGKNIK